MIMYNVEILMFLRHILHVILILHDRMHKSHTYTNVCPCLCQTTPICKWFVQGNAEQKLELSMMKDSTAL